MAKQSSTTETKPYLLYYVAMGKPNLTLAKMSIISLFANGFSGQVQVVTDQTMDMTRLPTDRVKFHQVPSEVDEKDQAARIWEAKLLKAGAMSFIEVDGMEAVMFLDSDTLFVRNADIIFDRIVKQPSKIFLAKAGNRRLKASPGFLELLTKQQIIDLPEDLMMVDSYAVGFVPNATNLTFIKKDWVGANQVMVERAYKSDAVSLNLALIRTNRFGDAVLMPEFERLNGKVGDECVVEHYVYGQSNRMPAVFKGRHGDPNKEPISIKRPEPLTLENSGLAGTGAE